MARERIYDSNAERQAAYRARLNERQALAETGQLTGRLVELEAALAAALRRADQAEQRAARAERDTQVADRYAELLATRPGRLAGAPGWAKDRLEAQLAGALERAAEMEATVAELRARLATAAPTGNTASTTGLNRAARRQAERDRRRHGH